MSNTLIESIRENLTNPESTDTLLKKAVNAQMAYTQDGCYDDESFELDRDINGPISCLLIEDKSKGPYYLFERDEGGVQTIKEMSYDELLDHVEPEAAEKPEKPEMNFFDVILNVFGLSSKMNEYSRELEVYHARKAEVLEKNFGFEGLKYKKELLDEDVAETYVKKNKLTRAAPEKQVTDKVFTGGDNPLVTGNNMQVKHKTGEELKKEVAGKLLTKITQINGNEKWQARLGATQINDAINEGPKDSKPTDEKALIINTLANMQTYITKNEFSNDENVKSEIAQIYQNVTELCQKVYINTLNDDMNMGSTKDVNAYLTKAVNAGNLLPHGMVEKYGTVPQQDTFVRR